VGRSIQEQEPCPAEGEPFPEAHSREVQVVLVVGQGFVRRSYLLGGKKEEKQNKTKQNKKLVPKLEEERRRRKKFLPVREGVAQVCSSCLKKEKVG
jgi:hypothetical protein